MFQMLKKNYKKKYIKKKKVKKIILGLFKEVLLFYFMYDFEREIEINLRMVFHLFE